MYGSIMSTSLSSNERGGAPTPFTEATALKSRERLGRRIVFLDRVHRPTGAAIAERTVQNAPGGWVGRRRPTWHRFRTSARWCVAALRQKAAFKNVPGAEWDSAVPLGSYSERAHPGASQRCDGKRRSKTFLGAEWDSAVPLGIDFLRAAGEPL